ncbi:MAG: hypothetical protein ABW042_00215, partial [Phenylobacterium sp.]
SPGLLFVDYRAYDPAFSHGYACSVTLATIFIEVQGLAMAMRRPAPWPCTAPAGFSSIVALAEF